MTGSLAFDGAVGNAIGSLIRNRSLSRSGGDILRSGDPAEAQMMTDWLCRQGEHGKIELEDIQTAVEMLRGMMVMDTQRAVMPSRDHGTSKAMCTTVSERLRSSLNAAD
jgi:hypothetical protein